MPRLLIEDETHASYVDVRYPPWQPIMNCQYRTLAGEVCKNIANWMLLDSDLRMCSAHLAYELGYRNGKVTFVHG